jgi:hypothetical protein
LPGSLRRPDLSPWLRPMAARCCWLSGPHFLQWSGAT